MPASLRRADLERGKVLAILLVVLGHLVAREEPLGLQWYEPLRALLYSFHIAFLFYLSGYATGISGGDRRSGGAYRLMLRRRAARLLLPALLFGLVILVGKFVAARFIKVDNLPASPWSGLVDLIWHTDRSPAQSVWYLVVLFIFVAATSPIRRALAGAGAVACAIGLLGLAAVSLLPVPRLLYLHGICGNAVFFAAGIVAASEDANWTSWLDRHSGALACGLVLALTSMLVLAVAGPGALPIPFRRLATSLIALPALHALMRRLPPYAETALDALAPYGFAIYLLNTICIGLAKGVLMLALPWTTADFPLYAMVLTVAGIAGPVLAKRLLIRPLPLLDRLTG
jgi:fucose 4-O-acetylase-like acetyltransferase